MTVAEEEDATAIRPQTRDQAVGAGTHRRERLTPRAAVAEEIPAGSFKADVGGESAFIIAVVPLDRDPESLRRRPRSPPVRKSAAPSEAG